MGMKRLFSAALVCLVLAPSQLAAQGFESMKTARELGQMLASEEVCGLTFSQPAIETFIDKKVKPDDMAFTGHLTLMTTGSKVQIEDMSQSARTAHCAQVRRAAKAHGFIEE